MQKFVFSWKYQYLYTFGQNAIGICIKKITEMWWFSRNCQYFCTFLQNPINICSQKISKDHEKVMILKSDTDIYRCRKHVFGHFWKGYQWYILTKSAPIYIRRVRYIRNHGNRNDFDAFSKSLLKNWPKSFNEMMKKTLCSKSLFKSDIEKCGSGHEIVV